MISLVDMLPTAIVYHIKQTHLLRLKTQNLDQTTPLRYKGPRFEDHIRGRPLPGLLWLGPNVKT